MARDMQEYAQNALAEELSNVTNTFMDADDVIKSIEDAESDFDGDSYCPYYSQQVDVINEYERDFGDAAVDLCDQERTFKASEWQQAQTAYAYAIAFEAFSHYFETAKRELIDGIEGFVSDLQRELKTDVDRIHLSSTCTHGWAAHDRELSDGTMIFESRQLDGCNGMERNINGTWVSSCFDPTEAKDEDEDDHA